MADYAQVTDGVATRLDDARYVLVPGPPAYKVPVNSLWAWSEPERNAVSIYSIGRDNAPVPSDKTVVGRELRYDQPTNTVKWFPLLTDLPLADRKSEMRATVEERMREQITAGYSHDFGAGLGGVHVLDTSQRSKSEWLDYRNACEELITAGQGTSVMTLPIRTKADIDLAVRANQGMTAMQGMRAREGTIIAHARTLHDQIRLAADHAALDAININTGWPA